jgi:5-methylcytosine-specific restriction endonuclease McrA
MTEQVPDRVAVLLDAIGIDHESFWAYLEWALSEHLIAVLRGDVDASTFQRPDAGFAVRDAVRKRTGRRWTERDDKAIFQRLREDSVRHQRGAITYGEYLKLLWQVPFECSICGKAPPEVRLHIDHIKPVAHGGGSTRANLQFLCGPHNLAKADKRGTDPWLDLD